MFIPTTDVRGGTGANFIVDWAADGPIAEPVIEALMLGGLGSGQYAFISQGRPVKVVGGNLEHRRHCEEPTGPALGRPDDKLRDEAIQSSLDCPWIASLRSQ